MKKAILSISMILGAIFMTKNASAQAGAKSPVLKLNSGYEMPQFGLGTWTLSDNVAENSTYHALKNGYRLIDTAYWYSNERGVGRAVRRAISEGICTREEIFITTKLPPYGFSDYDKAIRDCADRLGVDYIDLMLVHQQGRDEKALYQAMERAHETGLVRSLGISNYYTERDINRVLSFAKIKPAVIQNENHPYHQNSAIKAFCAKNGILLESYYPLGGRGHTQTLFSDPTIAAIAKAHGKTSAQILLRWHIQSGYIAIPGSSNPAHIAENFAIFDFSLSDDEMKRINALDKKERFEIW